MDNLIQYLIKLMEINNLLDPKIISAANIGVVIGTAGRGKSAEIPQAAALLSFYGPGGLLIDLQPFYGSAMFAAYVL